MATSRILGGAGGHVRPIDGYAFGAIDTLSVAGSAFNALLGNNSWTARMLRKAGVSTAFWNAIPPTLIA